MDIHFAPKLKAGDEVRVIAPARSMAIISPQLRTVAKQRFDELGLVLTFGAHIEECDDFVSSSTASRLEDLHSAFSDPNVKGILSVIGGFSSNQLLDEIDWELIAANPKIFCGFSDITALNNSIFAKTGLVTYSGPHYSTFGMEKFFDYTLDYFKKCLMQDEPFAVLPSTQWIDDEWYLDQVNRTGVANEGWLTINEGTASGRSIGGNLCTLNLLQGTSYMPSLEDSILFIEDDEETNPVTFDRDLVSLIQQPGFSTVKGIVIGRFQNVSKVTSDLLVQIIKTKKALQGIPVIANVDFGHTTPAITFPIGGSVSIEAGHGSSIQINRH